MSPQTVNEIFKRLAEVRPEPVIELNYRSPYELLVSVMLSAQSTDKTVNKETPALFAEACTPEAMVNLGYDHLVHLIQRIGLYRNKAKNILATSQILIDKYGGKIPRTREDLESLPGVGRKTANIMLNILYGEKTIAVDTHIFRVANRIGLTHGKNVREVEDQLLAIVPDFYLKDAHQWLVLHGRYVCKARKPDCPHCVIEDLCEYPAKTPV